MAGNIEEFKALVSKKNGIARSNVWRVFLPSLPGATAQEVNLLCKSAQIPGRQVVTRERTIGAVTEKMAYSYLHDDVTLTFHLLNDYGIKQYFEVWQNKCFNMDTFEPGYKNEYSFDIKIQQLRKGIGFPVYSTKLGIPRLPAIIQNRLPKIGPFDFAQGELDINFITGDDVVYSCTLEDAFPVTVNNIDLNNDLDGLSELTISLAFTRVKDEFTGSGGTSGLRDTVIGTVLSRVFNR